MAEIAAADPDLLLATSYHMVDLDDPGQIEAATAWWQALTDAGGEGMVVKPLDFVARGKKGIIQPAIKCRDRNISDHLRPRLHHAAASGPPAGAWSRRQARPRHPRIRAWYRGLDRFVKHEPLRRVHECAFAVLALESEPVDPRL